MSRPAKTSCADLYSRVTDQIIADLARGVRPWTRPWATDQRFGPVSRPLRHDLTPYNGINVVLLWSEAMARGFSAPVWMTFRQALQLGGHVRRGEHGATVVYANRLTRRDLEDDGREVLRETAFLKAYTVFNLAQIEGLPERFHAPGRAPLGPTARIAGAEAFFAATGVDVRHGGDRAYYVIGADHVQMPAFERFADPQGYYATLAHEAAHWTRHPSRLDRDLGRQRWGDEGYAREELVAELAAAFLCADLGLELRPREDHAAYIDSWLAVLGHDRRCIFSAAAHAQRGCDFLHGLQPSA